MSWRDLYNLTKILKAKIGWVERFPGGHGAAVLEFDLPKDHWIYGEPECEGEYDFEPPPMTLRMGTDDPGRKEMADKIRIAARYAIRASTMKGTEDFDPDALTQNMVIGMLGYFTADGLSKTDEWANPK